MSVLRDVTLTFRINLPNFVTYFNNIAMYCVLLKLTVEIILDYVANLRVS